MTAGYEGRATGRTWPALVALGVSLVLTAAMAIGCRGGDSGNDLKSRAAKYWQLKQSKGWEEIYDRFLDPTIKDRLAKERFMKKRRLAFDTLAFEIGEVRQTDDAGSVEVKSDVNIPLRDPKGEIQLMKKQVTDHESWIRRDGVWYVVLTE